MNLVTLPLATPAQLPPYVASTIRMAFVGFFSSAVTLPTEEQRIIKATPPNANRWCIRSSKAPPQGSGAKFGPSCGLADLTPVARHLGENGLRALAANPPLNAADVSSVERREGDAR